MMNVATVHQNLPQQDMVVVSETAAIVHMIERAARDPAVDIDKMERLVALRERMLDRDAKIAFDIAFAKMQPELPVIDKKGRIQGESKRTGDKLDQRHGRWEDISPAVVPVISKHGFGIRFEQAQVPGPDGTTRTRITCIVSHSGHRESAYFDLPLDTTGSKNNVQAYGSTASYGRRYSATLALNIVTKGEDDDGRAAGSAETISDEQIKHLIGLINETGADQAKFIRYFKIDSLDALPSARFDEAVKMLNAKRKA